MGKTLPPIRRAWLLPLVLALALADFWAAPAEAQGRRLIRDAEIESIIRDFATPLFQAAGLNPQAIDVYLIEDKSLNAFVAGGQNLFIHTGLLINTEDPLELIGVIAHETGHIAGGHIASRIEELENTQTKVLASYILGLGAAIATGQPGLAVAIISGGQDIALKGLLSYSRSQEQAADQAAVKYLNATGQSPRGLLDFMRLLGDQEMLLASSQDPYIRTHPLTRERVAFLEEQTRLSPNRDTPTRPDFVALHKRMRAKLVGFLEPLERVFRKYPESDTSLEARYARSIAHYRRPDLKKALPLIDGLIEERPDDPFFHELRGQMLFENGRIAEAVPEYESAVRLRPDSSQLTLALARAQIEMNDPRLNQEALTHLQKTLDQEPNNAGAWRLAAIAHGRMGDTGMTALSLAEAALARKEAPEARDQSKRAQQILPEGSPGWLRAQDIQNLAEQIEKRDN
ncbi:MAG: M48 family metalloprotease [Kiloniellales bacterium]